MFEYPLSIPTYSSETGEWTTTSFATKAEFTEHVQSQFKLPGQYNLYNTSLWKQQALDFEFTGTYCSAVSGSSTYKKYWRAEKDKVLKGVIIDGFYIPPFYYFYLNFMQIFIKELATIRSPDVYDSDYHFFLYIMLCKLLGKHAVVVKTRQRGYSYKIMAILYWSYCWFKGSVNTIGASDISYVKKTWEYMDEYRNHINTKTAWRRGPQIPKSLEWIERTMTENGDYIGNGSKLRGTTFQQSPSKGVGGYQSFFFYEEAGIAPTLLDTIDYISPTISAGNITTGMMIVSGSVGELDQCDGLKTLFYKPEAYNFLAVDNVWEEDPEFRKVGFFVPESWSRVGFIDPHGNSLVAEAEEELKEGRKASKETKRGEQYQLEISQKPLTPKEAFDWRKDSFFPPHIVSREIERLDLVKNKLKRVELYEDSTGKVVWKELASDAGFRPIETLDLKADTDRRGCIIMSEPPPQSPQYLQYFAGVDPIATDKTTTSESLFAIYIFKNLVETKYEDDEGNIKIKVEGYKPVAWYVGRHEDIKSTNQVGEYLLRLYNAKAVIESNVQNFINHLQGKNLHKHMFTKDEIGFLEDLRANQNVHKQYGVHMTPSVRSYILQNIKEYISEILDYVRKPGTDEILKTIYGAERIDDIGAFREMQKYDDKLNVDRLIALGLAISIAKHYMVNGVYTRQTEVKRKDDNKPAVGRSFFKSLDGQLNSLSTKKSFFRRLS